MKSIIGIVGRCGVATYDRTSIQVLDAYRKSVIKSGGIGICILPPQDVDYYNAIPSKINKLTVEEKDIINEQLKICDGIILQGGTKRFEYDNYICDYCNKNNIPLLGICMGMQIMCNYDNDNKNILIDDDSHHSLEDYKHDVQIDKNSKLYEILNEEKITVNSLHHYKVSNSGNYKIAAKDNDIIEAVYKDGYYFNIGLQWHPEKTYDIDLNSQKIFKAFIEATKEYKEKKINK